jgi:AcrR family transcriptional regulator
VAPERKHDTDAILDATRALLLDGGPRAATIAAIAQNSGAPPGTLYHRFGSREGILAATWLRAVSRFQAAALAAAEQADPLPRAVGMARAALRFARGNPDDALLLLSLRPADALDRDAQRTLAQMNAPLEEHVRTLARDLYGRADARTADRVARAIVDVPYSAVRRHAPKLPRWLDDEVESAVRALLHEP